MGGNPGNGSGAYPNEMNEAIVFTDALRAAVPTRPDPRLADTLVPRLAATARTATLEAETRQTQRLAPVRPASRPRSRRALVARVAIAVALIPLLLAGLAVAGVTVPSPARSAFDSIGIDLPNQPRDKGDEGASAPSSHPSTSEEATTSGPVTESGAQGNGNSQAAHEHARSQRNKAKGKAVGHDRGKAVGLNEATPPGHSGQTGPPAHSNSGGNAGGSSGGGESTKAPKTSHAPKGVAKGHTKVPPGHSK
jgi:hypothetical protein